MSATKSGTNSGERNAGLDLLRTLACLLVVAYHLRTVLAVDFGPLNPVVQGGDTGVYVFFALSGYLLYRPFLRGPVDMTSYVIKRTSRIVPGYLVALICLALITRNPLAPENPLPYLSMTAPYNTVLRGFLGNAWTLSAEFIFYVVPPVLSRFVSPAPIPRFSVLALGSVVASALYAATVNKSGIQWIVGAFPFVFYAFVPGMLLAVVEARDPEAFRRLASPRIAIVGAGAILVQTLLHGVPIAVATGIGTPLVIGWLLSVRVPFARALAFTGGASYAMYLWHKDLFLSFGISGLLIAVVGASLSWVLIERPVLSLAHAVTTRRRRMLEPVLSVAPASP